MSGRLGYDLPPAWDGVEVKWGGWIAQAIHICPPLPVDQRCCHKCGAISDGTTGTSMNVGKRQHPDRPIRDLIAYRCTHCHQDHVWDQRTDEWWDLDDTDYTRAGSHNPERTLF